MNHCIIFGVTNGGLHRSAGAHRIATYLRSKNWDSEVVDFTEYWTLDQLKELVRSRISNNTKFIGLSLTFNYTSNDTLLLEFSIWLKTQWPEIKIISGGQSNPYFHNLIDYHIMGYAEYALDQLLSWLFSNGEQPIFDKKLQQDNTQVINSFNDYPAYPYPGATIKYETRDFMQPSDHGFIEFSRGCKFKCKFCNFPVLGVKGDYTRSQESVYEQLTFNYDNYGIENYSISDETFNDRTDKITKFADVVDRLTWRPYFAGFIRPDLLVGRPQDREELLRLGMLGHFYGVESFNAETGKYIGKGMNPEKMKEGLIDVKKFFIKHSGYKYRAHISLIGGLPYETLSSLSDTKQWIKKHWLDQTTMAIPLTLHREDDPRTSDLDFIFKDLGYREIKFDHNAYITTLGIDPTSIDTLTEYPHFQETKGDRGIVWENNNLNLYQAAKWGGEVNNLYKFDNVNITKVEEYRLAYLLCDNNGNQLTNDQKLKLVGSKIDQAIDNASIYLQNYINKKLSI
jgi:radical SAM superfamily enzyme YgiQ (UPF0313 family)